MNDFRDSVMPGRMRWLPPLVFLVNLGVVGLLITYSIIGLKPFIPPHDQSQLVRFQLFTFVVAVLLPTAATTVYLWPVFGWLRLLRAKRPEDEAIHAPPAAVVRAGNAPVNLAAFCLLTWVLVDILLFFRVWTIFSQITIGMGMHFFILPLLAGLIAAASVYFLAEYICRTYVWPLLFVNTPMEGNPQLWKVRVVHRLFLQMIAISFLPLSAVTFTALIRMDRLDAAADPILVRIIMVIILIGVSAALGGAWLAWLVARSIDRPLRRLERAMARLRRGDFSVRVPVTATDEIGAAEEGFNQMAQRLAESHEALEARNRELAEALERVSFLKRVKRGLDRFVPDTVRRLIEENPDAPGLHKAAKDVTVLFLDVEGYTRLSQELPPEKLNELIERYFSLYLSDIHAGEGDVNETAGDGLMILFQNGNPDEHALAAVRTALGILRKTAKANRELGEIHAPLSVNMGICSGVCYVGSTRLQSVTGERWTYTATGQVTNLAARLGDHARSGRILLNNETAQRVSGRFLLKKMGRVSLKNISEPPEVWEVEGAQEDFDEHAIPSNEGRKNL
ncbi:MAG: adenylate/guanylate cyclase domain-containing protein [Gemmatimonadota bacterium]